VCIVTKMEESIVTRISNTFWTETIWLPPNSTWNDIDLPEKARFRHLAYPLPLAFILMVLRFFLDRCLYRPVGKALGIKDQRKRSPKPNAVLEAAFQCGAGNYGRYDYKSLCTDTEMSERQIHVWMRMRNMAGKPTTLDKFSESFWRWTFYFSAHVISVWTLLGKPWVWNTFECWYSYPNHNIDSDVWWHYMLEMAFYWSLFFTQFSDVKRKDFVEMFIHHLATLALLTLSFTTQMHRIGSLVILVHDFADHWMELAKMAKYAGLNTLCDISFVIFMFMWTLRLGIFPTWIIYTTTVEAAHLIQMIPVYYIFNCLFSILLVLHIIWFYYIVKIAYTTLATGVTEDSRSDTDSADDEYEEEESDENKKKII